MTRLMRNLAISGWRGCLALSWDTAGYRLVSPRQRNTFARFSQPKRKPMLHYRFRSPDVIRSPLLRSLVDDWRACLGDEALPPPDAMSRGELGAKFESMSRLEVRSVYHKPRLAVVEQGQCLSEMYGAHCPGHFIDEVMPERKFLAALESYLKGLEKKSPIYTSWRMHGAQGEWLEEERILLPLGLPMHGVTHFWLGVALSSSALNYARGKVREKEVPRVSIKAAIDAQG
jgi:hypothetical protein